MLGLGSLAATPYLVKEAVKLNPKSVIKIANKTGQAIEKGTEYALKYGQKALKSNAVQKAIGYVQQVFTKFKGTKIGEKVVDLARKAVSKITSNATVQKVVTKAADALKKFASSSTTKKGVIGLAAAGIALLAYGGIKTITNYYKKEGAIDQKYKDMKVMNNYLA